MDADKYERSSKPYSNSAVIETSITELTKVINTIRDYENPYQYITFMDSDTSKQITVEITPDILTSIEIIKNQIDKLGNKSNVIQAIMSKYSILDHEKQYKLTRELPLETKINMIYAENLKYSRYYCDWVLPPKYAPLFRQNGYTNIYDKVKDELLAELNDLINRKIELLVQDNK